MTKKRCYIAGPISKGDINHNIAQAREAYICLVKAGLAPMNPMLTCYLDGCPPQPTPGGITWREWCDIDIPWVAVSDCLLRLPGESVGADGEVECANSHRVPVFYSIDELIKVMGCSTS